MIQYATLADEVKRQIAEYAADHARKITLTPEQAMQIYLSLLGMDRMRRIIESDHGGAEFMM